MLWYAVCLASYYGVRFYVTRGSHIWVVTLGAILGAIVGGFLVEPTTLESGIETGRSGIQNLNANFTSYVLVGTAYLVILMIALFERRRWMKWAGWACFAFIAIISIRLDTRGAMISMALMVIWHIYTVVLGTRTARITFIVVMSACLLISSGILTGNLTVIETFFERNTGDLSGRLPTWELARTLIVENIFTGIGAGAFQYVNPAEIGAHNIFLVLLLDTGLFGFLAFLSFLICGLWPALGNQDTNGRRYVLGLFTAYFFPIAISGHIELSPFTWIVMGLTFTMIRPQPASHA